MEDLLRTFTNADNNTADYDAFDMGETKKTLNHEQ